MRKCDDSSFDKQAIKQQQHQHQATNEENKKRNSPYQIYLFEKLIYTQIPQ